MPHFDANDAIFKKEVKDFNGKVLICFHASWCSPCKMLSPLIDELSEKIKVVKVDIEEYGNIAEDYGVQSLPTVIIFNNGQPIESIIGSRPKEVYLKAIE